jgi:hypothetical protein
MGLAGAGNIGVVIDSLLAPRLAAAYGWQSVFGFALIPAVFVLVIYIVFSKEPPNPATPKKLRDYFGMFRDKDVHWFCFFYTVTFGGFVGLAYSLGMYFKDRFGLSLAGGRSRGALHGDRRARPADRRCIRIASAASARCTSITPWRAGARARRAREQPLAERRGILRRLRCVRHGQRPSSNSCRNASARARADDRPRRLWRRARQLPLANMMGRASSTSAPTAASSSSRASAFALVGLNLVKPAGARRGVPSPREDLSAKVNLTSYGLPKCDGAESDDSFAVKAWDETVIAVLADGAGARAMRVSDP